VLIRKSLLALSKAVTEVRCQAFFGCDRFSTGREAKILGVAPRTVTKWCDNGTLKCWRLPGDNDRRISAHDLYNFMVEGGYPLHDFPQESLQWVERKRLTILFFGEENTRIRKIITVAGGTISFADNIFDADIQMKTSKPDVVLLDGAFRIRGNSWRALGLCSQMTLRM